MPVEFESKGEATARQILDATLAGLTSAAERLLTWSKEQVPFELGTLDDSGAVQPATDPEVGAGVTYNTPYAKRHHEHPEYNFQGGRKGKYVEDPALEHADELGAIVAAEVRRTVGGGI